MPRTHLRPWNVALGAVFLLAAGAVAAEPGAFWPQWRGPSSQGYADDARVPLEWSETTNLLWKTALPGPGNSTPVVWGERMYLTCSSSDGKERRVLCTRTTDGKILWDQLASKGVPPEKTHQWNGYASASCATDGKLVFAFFGTPGLFCYDVDGKLVWKHNFGVFTSDRGWGAAASPFLFEDLVIQNCDNSAANFLPAGVKAADAAPAELVALEKATGKVRWRTPRNQGVGFSTPLLIPMPDGRIDLVMNGPYGVWGYDPRTGKELWHCERHKGQDDALYGEPMPAFNKEALYAVSGRPGPFQGIKLGGTGDLSRTHVLWDVKRGKSRDVSSPILVGETLFVADRFGNLTAHDAKTGKQLFNERAGGKSFTASPILLQGKLLYLREDGTTYVLEPERKLKVVSKNVLSDGTEFRASPAVADGRLFLRSQSHLYAIGKK